MTQVIDFIGGEYRNRTGVHGFAIRCVTTPPTRRACGLALVLPQSGAGCKQVRGAFVPRFALAFAAGVLPALPCRDTCGKTGETITSRWM